MLYSLLWQFCSIFYLVYVSLVDTCMLLNILCMDNSVTFDQGEDEKSRLQNLKFYIYRDLIGSIK